MQIFVKIQSSRIVVVEAAPSDTIQTVIARAFQKVGVGEPPGNERLVIDRGTLRLRWLEQTISDYGIQAESTLTVRILPPDDSVGDASVIPKLQAFLRSSAGELHPQEFTFIGLGCFDHGHGLESIKRQQCPDALLEYCIARRVDLNIILIDPGFDAEETSPQIYDQPGWVHLLSEEGGKIRRYKYAPATSAGACDVWITVFATKIPEYGSALVTRGKVIAGIDVHDLFRSVIRGKAAGACLVCGNFYSHPTDKGQFFTLGSEDVVTAAGFEANP